MHLTLDPTCIEVITKTMSGTMERLSEPGEGAGTAMVSLHRFRNC